MRSSDAAAPRTAGAPDAGRERAPALHHMPVGYFAERLRRLRYFSLARLDAAWWSERAGRAAALRGDLSDDVAARLGALSTLDPDLFVASDAARDAEAAAAAERTLPPGYVPEDAAFLRAATLDGSIRALYEALRPLHVVAIGPASLAGLALPLRLARFEHRLVTRDDALAGRHAFLERLVRRHLLYRREPVAYLFDAGPVTPWWVLELHGRLPNAFLLDLGATLGPCLPERLEARGWGEIHWRAVARHLGLDPGPRRAGPRTPAPPRPGDAPGRPRPQPRAPAVDRRRAGSWHRPELDARAETPRERLHEGDLERCLRDLLARRAGA